MTRLGRLAGATVLAAFVLAAGNGLADGLWWRAAGRVWTAARAAPRTVAAACVLAAAVALLWRAGGRPGPPPGH